MSKNVVDLSATAPAKLKVALGGSGRLQASLSSSGSAALFFFKSAAPLDVTHDLLAGCNTLKYIDRNLAAQLGCYYLNFGCN